MAQQTCQAQTEADWTRRLTALFDGNNEALASFLRSVPELASICLEVSSPVVAPNTYASDVANTLVRRGLDDVLDRVVYQEPLALLHAFPGGLTEAGIRAFLGVDRALPADPRWALLHKSGRVEQRMTRGLETWVAASNPGEVAYSKQALREVLVHTGQVLHATGPPDEHTWHLLETRIRAQLLLDMRADARETWSARVRGRVPGGYRRLLRIMAGFSGDGSPHALSGQWGAGFVRDLALEWSSAALALDDLPASEAALEVARSQTARPSAEIAWLDAQLGMATRNAARLEQAADELLRASPQETELVAALKRRVTALRATARVTPAESHPAGATARRTPAPWPGAAPDLRAVRLALIEAETALLEGTAPPDLDALVQACAQQRWHALQVALLRVQAAAALRNGRRDRAKALADRGRDVAREAELVREEHLLTEIQAHVQP